MQVRPLEIDGVALFTPAVHGDERGRFLESFRADALAAATGRTFAVAQTNVSVSRRGVIRGVHFALVPPGQAKYVTCVAGTVLDIAVDVRVGSPTFGRHVAAELDDRTHMAMYLEEGLGHAFTALTEEATVAYLCSTPYTPDRELGIHPLDEELALPWPADATPVLSARDAAAPGLADAAAAGLLPTLAECRAWAPEVAAR